MRCKHRERVVRQYQTARVAIDHVDGIDQAVDRDRDAGFLQNFANGRSAQCLAPFDMTAGQRPQALPWRLATFDQQNRFIVKHHGAHADQRQRAGLRQLSR